MMFGSKPLSKTLIGDLHQFVGGRYIYLLYVSTDSQVEVCIA